MEELPSPIQTATEDETVKKLAAGLLDHCEPELKKVKSHLDDLLIRQNQADECLTNLNKEFAVEVYTMNNQDMETIKLYKNKLVNIKKQMMSIHSRVKNLKKRAIYVEESKKKEVAMILQKRQKEEDLIHKSGSTVTGNK